jgi:hypothetical protein
VAGHGQRSFDEGNMKHYTGVRTESGCIVCVTEIRDPAMTTRSLDPRHDLRNHSPDGFEWGYGGSGPAVLFEGWTIAEVDAAMNNAVGDEA